MPYPSAGIHSKIFRGILQKLTKVVVLVKIIFHLHYNSNKGDFSGSNYQNNYFSEYFLL